MAEFIKHENGISVGLDRGGHFLRIFIYEEDCMEIAGLRSFDRDYLKSRIQTVGRFEISQKGTFGDWSFGPLDHDDWRLVPSLINRVSYYFLPQGKGIHDPPPVHRQRGLWLTAAR